MTTLSRPLAGAAGLGLGYLADLLVGDPRRGHPVAGFGQLAGALEARCYADDRRVGAAYTLVLVGGTAGLGLLGDRLVRRRRLAEVLLTAAAAWAVLGGRSLRSEAARVRAALVDDDLPAARQRITHLVGRDPSQLDAAELSRACVESVAENTSDAVVAPLLWGAVAGVPGLLAYRAVNTLDAMVGHRSPRYLRFGWASARLDDLANWVPARLAGVLTAAAAGAVGGTARDVSGAVRRDAGQHPSPNAGVVEAAFAGALGVRLGGRNVYAGAVEERGTLGDGRPVGVPDIAPALRLSALVSAGAAATAVLVRAAVPVLVRAAVVRTARP